MGKDKGTWAELTPREVQVAATLGFDAIYWDNGMTPDAIALPWSALQPPLRAAAMVLGYTATEWNEIGGYEELIPAASAAPAAAAGVAVGPKGKDKAEWSLLLPQEMQAATMLGFDAVQWDNGMTPETSAVPWSALQPPLRAAAQVLGYTAKEWNEDGGYEEEAAAAVPTTNAPLPTALPPPLPPPTVTAAPPMAPPAEAAQPTPKGKDKATWAELTPEEMRAAATLGFDAEYWDNGMTPDAIALPWSALPPPLRAAAMVLDYTARDWNEDGGFDE